MYTSSRSVGLHSWYICCTAVVVAVSLLAWATGLPFQLSFAHAAQLSDVSDTLSTSRPGVGADHTITFTNTMEIPADGSTIVIAVPAGFDMSTIGEDDVDVVDDGTDLTTDSACGAVQAAVSTSSQAITIEICTGGGGTIATASVVTIKVGAHASASGVGTHRMVNHVVAGTYEIGVGGTMADEGYTQLVIVTPVVVSGEVATYLAFTIDGVDAGGTVNQDPLALTGTSTAVTIPFGVVQPDTEYLLAQDIAVTTNAINGFTVTVEATDDLRSTSNATIDSFFDGTALAVPGTWDSPSATIGAPDTYGHWGLTTQDRTLSDNDSFGDALYAGNFINTPREVLYATSSADGATADIGATRVGYKLEVSVMQEAARDYTTTLTYVVTPVF